MIDSPGESNNQLQRRNLAFMARWDKECFHARWNKINDRSQTKREENAGGQHLRKSKSNKQHGRHRQPKIKGEASLHEEERGMSRTASPYLP